MTDYIVELPDGRVVSYYVDDGKNQVTLVTKRSSILTRKIRKVNVKKILKALRL